MCKVLESKTDTFFKQIPSVAVLDLRSKLNRHVKVKKILTAYNWVPLYCGK